VTRERKRKSRGKRASGRPTYSVASAGEIINVDRHDRGAIFGLIVLARHGDSEGQRRYLTLKNQEGLTREGDWREGRINEDCWAWGAGPVRVTLLLDLHCKGLCSERRSGGARRTWMGRRGEVGSGRTGEGEPLNRWAWAK
jgi:hypothetical protein